MRATNRNPTSHALFAILLFGDIQLKRTDLSSFELWCVSQLYLDAVVYIVATLRKNLTLGQCIPTHGQNGGLSNALIRLKEPET